MSAIKKIHIVFLIAIFFLVAITSVNAQEGCCINPRLPPIGLLCSGEYTVNECCDPLYCSSGSYSGFGPTDCTDCEANYFIEGDTACNSAQVGDVCITGCCCLGQESYSAFKIECDELKRLFPDQPINFTEGYRCADVCARPQCSDGGDNDQDGCTDFPADMDCASGSDSNELGDLGCPHAEKCQNPSYKPVLAKLEILPVKGEKQLTLTWDDECQNKVTRYDIERCEGAGCTNFNLIATSLSNSFNDDSITLLWGAAYAYRIKAHYFGRAEPSEITGSGKLGNLECWGQKTTDTFCIQEAYYNRYPGYLPDAAKFNKAYKCDSQNKLSSPVKDCEETSGICVIIDKQPVCLTSINCKTNDANPFGLYNQKTQCEQDKYCFYDRSHSLIDYCFACNPAMGCYDYKSKESCETDNCRIGSCQWKSTLPFGTGVCISTADYNCEWCDKKGTEGMENLGAFNAIFDACTQKKSDALAVGDYGCYFKDGKSKSCSEVTCRDYVEDHCTRPKNIKIGHEEFNDIRPVSNDPCRINVCQWFNAGCYKNQDGDGKKDCDADNCEKDFFAPNTTLTPEIDKGIYKSLIIQILDKTSKEIPYLRKTGIDYKTYLCVYNTTSYPACISGHPYDKFTANYKLVVSNLNLFEIGNPTKNWSLDEGFNIIRYYSQDPSSNIGLVDDITIEAHWNTTGPIIALINITGATYRQEENIYYTNNVKPIINVVFYEPSIITYAGITDKLKITQTPALNPPDAGIKEHSEISFIPQTNLGEGEYTFQLDAKNPKNNIFMGNQSVKFVVDNIKPSINITPKHGSIIDTPVVFINLSFTKEVALTSVTLNNLDMTANFSSGYNKQFTAKIKMPDGQKTLRVMARDYAGNIVDSYSVFSVNALPPEINITEPTYGVSPVYMFNITVTTDNNVHCRYYFDAPPPPLPSRFTDWQQFDKEEGIEHKIKEFDKIPGGDTAIHDFHVACNDPLWGISSETFELSVDPTPPVVRAFADDIIQLPLNTTIYAETDDDTICRYDKNNVNYANMRYSFPMPDNPYKKVHRQMVSVETKEQASYGYYVACENKAGLISNIETASFNVNLDVPLALTSHTNRTSSKTEITLSVETNKYAYCFYGTDKNLIKNRLGSTEKTKGHDAIIKNLAVGSHIFYVKCDVGEGGELSGVLEIPVTIDTTAPNMVYVNDTSTLENNPEYEWRTNKLRVKWLGKDNETSVSYYSYLLEEYFSPYKAVVNWTESSAEDEWLWVDGLNLSDDLKYNFRVKAKNVVGLVSAEMKSDGIAIDTSLIDPSCSNSIKDGTESDADCGGSCELCELSKTCGDDGDCLSGYCDANKKCATPTCSDNTKQAVNKETDVDCGGAKCSQCIDGKKCIINSDCASSNCGNGICGKQDSCSDGEFSSGETDIDCGGVCPAKCSEGKDCDKDGDCAAGLKCISNSCASEAQALDTDGDGMPDDWEDANGLDKNDPGDASLDNDKDGLSNLEEYNVRDRWAQSTDPNDKDTDGDGFSDKKEIDSGTDPIDPASYPKSSKLIIFLLILGMLILLGGAGYLAYVYYYQPKKVEKITQGPFITQKPVTGMPSQIKPAIRPAPKPPKPTAAEEKLRLAVEKKKGERAEEKKKKREELFAKFAPEKEKMPQQAKQPEKLKEAETKPPAKKQESQESIVVEKLKEAAKGKDVFKELSQLSKSKAKKEAFKKISMPLKKEKTPAAKKAVKYRKPMVSPAKPKKDVFKELSGIIGKRKAIKTKKGKT